LHVQRLCCASWHRRHAKMLKPSQNKKGLKICLSCDKNGVFFYSWQLRKRHHFWCS
jgi:hypothetical protein